MTVERGMTVSYEKTGSRKLIADHPDEVFIHEAVHDRFIVDMDTPEDDARLGLPAAQARSPVM